MNCAKHDVNLEIWDTAGQERYKSITKNFFRSAEATIIVFDITNRDSFENITIWANSIEINCPKSVVKVIVGKFLTFKMKILILI
jgi:small GTP-binding protein